MKLKLHNLGWKINKSWIIRNLNLEIEPSIYVEDNGEKKNTNQFTISGETLNSGSKIQWSLTKTLL